MGSKRRAARPKATSWDKVSAQETDQTLAHRDVYEGQQLDRGKIAATRAKTPRMIVAVAIGVIAFLIAWIAYSLLATALGALSDELEDMGTQNRTGQGSPRSTYYVSATRSGEGGVPQICYRPVDQDGRPVGTKCYRSRTQVPVPAWYRAQQQETPTDKGNGHGSGGDRSSPGGRGDGGEGAVRRGLVSVSGFKLLTSLGAGGLAGLSLGSWLSRRVDSENLMNDTTDINQHHNDQHIALPEEVQRQFDWFPDAGAHSSVQVSSMISHAMLLNKGLDRTRLARHASGDIRDEDGDLIAHRGEMLTDAEGEPILASAPMIDEAFGTDLFDASGLPQDKRLRKRYDTTKIPYNPKNADRNKLGGYDRVCDLINKDWSLPCYEVQRPAGAYIVDTSPVNTMVLAITRAGKGQTYIEPMLDMWSREKKPSNMVINDPKGELLVKNYVPFSRRGYEVVQFNLINVMKTDIYNPLGMAAEAAREGDSAKCALYVENIADVFFPLDGAEDPVWPNAANNAFKRAAYGLIDFYLEEEREMREHAAATGMDPETLEANLDDMWGKVTLYNCYQLFVQLTSKKLKSPIADLERRIKAGEYDHRTPEGAIGSEGGVGTGAPGGVNQEAIDEARAVAERQEFLWEGKGEQDMLTLFFNATEALPTNTMRTLIANANNALRAMAGAEKMLASVYGIAITAMSFFTDPTISTLTSGTPSQNADLGGLSFPRRLGVRFAADFLKRNHLIGQQALWRAYADPEFTRDLGADFEHSDIVSREGWARYYFKGIFPAEQAWLKLELVNPATGMLVRTFRFHFKKGYQTSLNGRHYVLEPVTGKKIVKNGVLRELIPERHNRRNNPEGASSANQTSATSRDGDVGESDRTIGAAETSEVSGSGYEPGDTLYPHTRLVNMRNPEKVTTRSRAITQTMVRYSEAPKAVFLVTPPHLMKYAKLILILVKQLVDLNFDKSYMTKNSQKPLYRTRFMLDELGNLQSEGHGIAGFETMLSIGLGQEQQFTLILQTLQQLRDVYGESVDKIVQGNTSNIVFLKSTDDTMIETLEKMSGKRHRTYRKSKQVTQNLDQVIHKTDGRVIYTMETVEEPVISYNDMAFIPPNNSVVFRAGDAPVWNRNETILPMMWKLGGNKIVHPGHDYSLQTIPTLSTALDFDVRRNQPNFIAMLDKRLAQADCAGDAKLLYSSAHGYTSFDIERLDPDVYA
ncbi:MAG: type IV secretory system conjugative DNA transfer family protein, partial [Pseudonocardiaceae bacterium]